ncbi:hypothetical protein C0Q70_15267 [Pomacea canaliculata]|uniref:Uncharacterized protein n=1 Tax=Pomacea canaliculata TaxID=400727 RepID=A0A2T7NUE5_POMCA|nr:hypothetical protein C0Q70_15267 [Pomacea canaliculata]
MRGHRWGSALDGHAQWSWRCVFVNDSAIKTSGCVVAISARYPPTLPAPHPPHHLSPSSACVTTMEVSGCCCRGSSSSSSSHQRHGVCLHWSCTGPAPGLGLDVRVSDQVQRDDMSGVIRPW